VRRHALLSHVLFNDSADDRGDYENSCRQRPIRPAYNEHHPKVGVTVRNENHDRDHHQDG
jgi:hypothetical protein